jgi:hypothetical protein
MVSTIPYQVLVASVDGLISFILAITLYCKILLHMAVKHFLAPADYII